MPDQRNQLWALPCWVILVNLVERFFFSVFSFFLFFFFFIFFKGLHQQHLGIPSVGVESELQLLAYATVTATQDPNHI